jgi:hypothetical protein
MLAHHKYVELAVARNLYMRAYRRLPDRKIIIACKRIIKSFHSHSIK